LLGTGWSGLIKPDINWHRITKPCGRYIVTAAFLWSFNVFTGIKGEVEMKKESSA
jgi:hypothetical protein